ncbi:dinitrogenase iron-molybdenum cofactor biosynthesis protein [Thermosipho sp. 1063]|uniref:NifB/NifX family molybdenum-iron cluster-binding protein n=1 Tax=unclassified Thermosipho (in: thermotogales) TaxID=2676525 RepID=UPI000949354C|nr:MULTISPECIES: NifB/NifX family molybdenum-iron cluster-binding protein [unclassified Thermosipho (in: thermotogales)]ANQ54151.1 dinitrogenase iron-molybdenum cofactor biosynthesis protein [Thermosipho sp. 1070]APT72596.1 dinitrogenase iron-molybdenum cofactor biosynthesis protein [Thermosipho sp. 1063]OOC41995.1 dinitrogenase iron-molybdenum cofactor biosynthesis protein [Thermosipho sp. 1074]
MKIAIPSEGKILDSMINDRYARAEYIIIYDTEKDEIVEVIENDSSEAHGKGPKVSQMLVNKGVKVLISQSVGKNAFDVLKAAKIDVYITQKDTVKNTIENFKNGKLEKTESATN